MGKNWDVLGIGTLTVDNMIYVDGFPLADTKMKVIRTERHGGGMAATAMVAVTRLGLSSAFAGIIGPDEASLWAKNNIRDAGVDVSPIVQLPDAQIISAFIIIDEGNQTRTILYHIDDRFTKRTDLPSTEMLHATKILLVDDTISGDIIHIAKEARQANIDVVADFESNMKIAMDRSINHLIVPASFALRVTNQSDVMTATRLLWHDNRDVVVVTGGDQGCWYYTGTGEIIRQPAFPVSVVDTTGCGDVFHGAYCVGLRLGWDVNRRIQFASATAAMKARHSSGWRGIPNQQEVTQFLAQYGITT